MKEFDELIKVIKTLRGPNGCPWDREQTLESLKPYLLEETYEVLEAMDYADERLKSELGDLLLHIIFQADILEEKKIFEIKDVILSLKEKLIRRHPHVFGNIQVENTSEVLSNWEKIKKEEKEHKNRVSILDGIPQSFPALLRAEKLQKKASKVGFDWKNLEDVFEKVKEELKELELELRKGNQKSIEEELGDLFFTLVNLSRHLKIDSEMCLKSACDKFEKRFRYIENRCNMERTNSDEMESLWNEAKIMLEKK